MSGKEQEETDGYGWMDTVMGHSFTSCIIEERDRKPASFFFLPLEQTAENDERYIIFFQMCYTELRCLGQR